MPGKIMTKGKASRKLLVSKKFKREKRKIDIWLARQGNKWPSVRRQTEFCQSGYSTKN